MKTRMRQGASDMGKEVETEALDTCPVCGSARSEAWAAARDRQFGITAQEFLYRRCGHCRVVFQAVRPVEAMIGHFYPEAYGPHADRGASRPWLPVPPRVNRIVSRLAAGRSGTAAFQARVQQFYDALAGARSLLDFGCGSGKFLDRGRKLGCETIGMDFSDKALAEVQRRGHRALSASTAGWQQIPAGSIDMVRMNHVVEHLYDPAAVLRQVYARLAPGGRLHVATPNPDGIAAETYRETWWGLECPRHIVLFPPGSLATLLEQAGFREIEIVHEPASKDLARSWAFRQVDQGRMSADRVEGLADDGLLNLWFAGQAAAAARAGRGDRIHAFARKSDGPPA